MRQEKACVCSAPQAHSSSCDASRAITFCYMRRKNVFLCTTMGILEIIAALYSVSVCSVCIVFSNSSRYQREHRTARISSKNVVRCTVVTWFECRCQEWLLYKNPAREPARIYCPNLMPWTFVLAIFLSSCTGLDAPYFVQYAVHAATSQAPASVLNPDPDVRG